MGRDFLGAGSVSGMSDLGNKSWSFYIALRVLGSMGDVISTMNKVSDTEWAFTLNQPQGWGGVGLEP